MEKYDYASWQRLSKSLKDTKENLEELSKLYIVAHQKVKAILRKTQVDLNYDPRPDAQIQAQFIQKILLSLDEKKNDQYLSQIDPAVLQRYEKNFLSLFEMIKVALLTNDSKINVRPSLLQGISESHHNKQYGLKNQIRASEKRMKRTKSGQRITRKGQTPQLNEEIPQKNIQFVGAQEHLQKVQEKQSNLQKMINSQIQKEGLSLNFKKKYENLDKYLNQRKQFADLLFCQRFYDDIIFESQTRKNQPKPHEIKNPDINKIFPQFNVKTKFLKPQVKENILKVIYDVKKALLEDYHKQNIQKMQDNEGKMMEIDQKLFQKKKKKMSTSEISYSEGEREKKMRFLSTNRSVNNFRKTINTVGGSTKASFKNAIWNDQKDKIVQKKIERRLSRNRMPVYQK